MPKIQISFQNRVLKRLTASAVVSAFRSLRIVIVFAFVLPLRLAAEPEAVGSTVVPAPSPSPSLPLLTWKEQTAKGYLPYHQLTVEDFPINDSAHPEGAYWVQPFVHYYYHYLTKIAQRGGYVYAYIMDWTVFSGFDKNLSSRKSRFREMNAELPFAQAILDISELHARRFAALKPGELPSGDGRTRAEARQKLQSRLDAFYQAEVLEVQKEVDAFVTATNRGQDKKKVGELSAEIRKRLAETSPAPTALPTASPSPQTTAAPTAPAGASP
jgi:hypothetical protein